MRPLRMAPEMSVPSALPPSLLCPESIAQLPGMAHSPATIKKNLVESELDENLTKSLSRQRHGKHANMEYISREKRARQEAPFLAEARSNFSTNSLFHDINEYHTTGW